MDSAGDRAAGGSRYRRGVSPSVSLRPYIDDAQNKCTVHAQAIERQAAAGIAEASALVLVVDGQTGVTGADEEIVSWLRKTHPKKPVRIDGLDS